MSSDFTFQFTQGFSSIYECKWGNIKVSTSYPYILAAFWSLYLQQYFKKHLIIRTMNHEFISSGCSPFWIRQTLFSLIHRFVVCALTFAASEHTKKKSKSLRLNGSVTFFPKKCWNCQWSWVGIFELCLPFIFDASRTSRKSCFKRHTFGCYRANWSKIY